MFDALAEFAVARRQFGAAFVELSDALVELPLEFHNDLLRIGCCLVEHRGHAPAPASDRTSSEI